MGGWRLGGDIWSVVYHHGIGREGLVYGAKSCKEPLLSGPQNCWKELSILYIISIVYRVYMYIIKQQY